MRNGLMLHRAEPSSAAMLRWLWQGQAMLSGLKEANLVVVSEWLTRSNSMALPGAVEMHKSVAECPYSHPVQGACSAPLLLASSRMELARYTVI